MNSLLLHIQPHTFADTALYLSLLDKNALKLEYLKTKKMAGIKVRQFAFLCKAIKLFSMDCMIVYIEVYTYGLIKVTIY